MNNNSISPALNAQQWLAEKIKEIKKSKQIPSLLLHSCCAPCSSYVLDYLSAYFSITVFFYNPNIHPEEEYKKRWQEQIKLLQKLPVKNTVNYITGPYEPELFFQKIKGSEQEPEGKRRCLKCFELRLEKTAQKAIELGCDYFTTTLTISPHKDALAINQIGSHIGTIYHLNYLYSDFKKKEGFKKSISLSHQYQLYRQNYCGCIFSNSPYHSL